MKKVRSKLNPTKIGVIKTFSLSPDDKIGEIAVECTGCTYYYNNLAELCEKWEDYEEPKEYYWLRSGIGDICETKDTDTENDKFRKSIGNYFSSREEAEQAVEKLKALTEAKEDGLKIKGYYYNHEDLVILADIGKCNKLTLDTLFGKKID